MISKMLEQYGFSTSDGLYYVRQRGRTVFLIVELKVNQDGEVVYDFYKLTTYLKRENKYYCENDGEEFFVRRFKKYFKNYEAWKKKKMLEAKGFKSEYEYYRYLDELRKKEFERQKKDEIARQQMDEANLKQVDKSVFATKRHSKKINDEQLVLNL